MNNYIRENIRIDNILLDVENPRFASYFERHGIVTPNQSAVIDYLLRNASINTLAANIRELKGLHASESIVCIKQGEDYVVLEGNRRVCACKVLCRIYYEKQTDWISSDVIPKFPLLDDINDKKLIDGISTLDAIVYQSREAAQPYISDKHIDGVKKWDSIEKSTYYYRMFHNKLNVGINPETAVDEIAKETVSKKGDIKECITKYSFYMSVYNALLKKYQPAALTETNSFLPLVDRFMGAIVENSDLGLNLPMSPQFSYTAHKTKEQLLENILFIVGEAFLARKPKGQTSSDELARINSQEVDTKRQQKKLIRDDVRIPGLLAAMQAYKAAPSAGTSEEQADIPASEDSKPKENANDKSTDNENTSEDAPPNGSSDGAYEMPFENEIPWTPKKPQRTCFGFTKDEYTAFGLSDEDDGDVKIKFIIRELSKLSVTDYPYSCSLLYRTLLESATRKAFDIKKPSENGNVIQYQENNLASMITKLTNNHLTLTTSNRGAIKANVNQQNFIATLNSYIHNPKLVDTNLLASTWVTMKEYVKACLS